MHSLQGTDVNETGLLLAASSLEPFLNIANIGMFPVSWYLTKADGLLENETQIRGYSCCGLFKNTCWYQVWAIGFSEFSHIKIYSTPDIL